MTVQNKVNLWDFIQSDFNRMQTNNTIESAILDFDLLLNNLKNLPPVNEALIQLEDQIAEEDRIAFDKYEKAVVWIQNKIRLLLPFLSWKNDSWQMHHTHSLLEFQMISLGTGGYLRDLFFELKGVILEAHKNQASISLLDNWAKVERLGSSEFIIKFHFPDFLYQEINKPRLHIQINQLKEKADSSFRALYRFLKILTLYASFPPLTLSTNPSSWDPPKNLQDLENRDYHMHVGRYFNSFKSSDIKKRPFKMDELCRLVKLFIFILDREIRTNASLCIMNKPSSKPHSRTQQRNDDVKTLILFAKNTWKQILSECKHPGKIGTEKLAQELLEALPKNISLYSKDKKRLPRARTAIKNTDPRIFENGKFVDLKPHWQNFSWIEI